MTNYFLPILKENPKEAEIISHRLMLRAGMIKQHSSGIYSWLPLGKRVLDKICNIVKYEQNKAGSNELLMPTLQGAEIWRESGRYDDYGFEMLRIKDRHEREMLYGPTNEEMATDIFRNYVRSYKELPVNLYQIQWKFRDELRPRFGVMRGREFLMKDGYSFDVSASEAETSYNKMFVSYLRSFAKMGLQVVPMQADTGPIGGDLSHEFIVLAKTGESAIYCDKKILNYQVGTVNYSDSEEIANIVNKWRSTYAATEEKHDINIWNNMRAEDRIEARGIEVGHIFYFGTKYSEAMQAKIMGSDGKEIYVAMGSYGLGISRIVAAAIEASHDEQGIIWPQNISPFDLAIINMRPSDDLCNEYSEDLYAKFTKAGFDVLLDDTTERAGAKFATMDLIGLPYQIIIGPKDAANGIVEVKIRKNMSKQNMSLDEAFNFIADAIKKAKCEW